MPVGLVGSRGQMPSCDTLPGNFLPDACKGCVVVHRSHPLILGIGPARKDDAPFRWDPDDKVFSVVNVNKFPCFTYLTFCGVDVHDRHGQPFAAGVTRAEGGEERPATTFVVVVDPRTAVRLGRLEDGPVSADLYAIELERLVEPPASLAPLDESASTGWPAFGFPLPAASGPYLCTQGVGGHLTHFFPASFHAIDLRCSCHTPVLSIGDGIVKEVAESHRCGGIHAANLAAWNSVSVQLSCGLIVEYLHTLPGSAKVKTGDAVQRGQVLCESGDIGFAPEPHLHIELHTVDDSEGPSLPLHFSTGSQAFVPVAGRWYSPDGEVPPPAGCESEALAWTEVGGVPVPPPPVPRRAVRFGCAALKRKISKANALRQGVK
mmetsp:Transcript_28109/g.66429  ORF Transcript_28109/g.66429 Transcript_28109/m.66429 type:complete len:377 (+) Transcript_28109:29-1159(+)